MITKFKLGKCKLTIDVNRSRWGEDFIGDEKFTVPNGHVKGMFEYFGEDVLYKFIDREDFDIDKDSDKNLSSHNSDVLIHWLRWLSLHEKSYTLFITAEPFWVVHDCFHAIHDFSGSAFYCSPYQELVRHRQAYTFLKRRKITVDYHFLETIVEAFNNRKWGCNFEPKRRPVFVDDITNFKGLHNIKL